MKHITNTIIAGAILLFFSCATPENTSDQSTQSKERYKPWNDIPELFEVVQMNAIFPDSKTFVDYSPNKDLSAIRKAYAQESLAADFELSSFVSTHFDAPQSYNFPKMSEGDIVANLTKKWDYLTREAADSNEFSTLIAMPYQYVVPGGRFREVYYWDSYFTMIGLGVSGRNDLIASMLDNFAFLIEEVGFVPNGNRTYYLGRSQPPFFASMVALYGKLTSDDQMLKYLPAIEKEYNFWMSGAELLSEQNKTSRRTVYIAEGVVLNRYWDDLDFPRPESHREDVELAEHLEGKAKNKLYRNLRAGAESGWDYSTRWFSDKSKFSTIRTTEMIPVDLNSLLFQVESLLAQLYQMSGDKNQYLAYTDKANKRQKAINTYCWNNELKAYTDYLFTENTSASQLTLAGYFPLYFKIATDEKAQIQLQKTDQFLMPGGLVTTTIESGQQWDAPNGWAPLQWIGMKGAAHYGAKDLADQIANRWISVNKKVFNNTGKMMEKYNVMDTTLLAGGGEYPTQDGFGWSNGVLLGMLADEEVAY
ncbi:MAG: alpha,alpha-trehalase TreF [Cyclobacteriaceae bacterium]